MACKDRRTIMRAFVDFNPMRHQAACGCGYETFMFEDSEEVLKELNWHRTEREGPREEKDAG